MDNSIVRTLIEEAHRSQAAADLFGVLWPLRIEPYIFHTASTLASAYRGGFWQFYDLRFADGFRGFFMAPEGDQPYEVYCAGNFWSGTLSAEALGIVCCLHAYSHLSFCREQDFSQLMIVHYDRLRLYALEHVEVEAIMGAID